MKSTPDLNLCLSEESGSDFEDDALVLEEGSDGAHHHGAPARRAVDLALEVDDGTFGPSKITNDVIEHNWHKVSQSNCYWPF